MQVALAIVHHANQYLVTEGYENRDGLSTVLGTDHNGRGFRRILEAHTRYGVPGNIHISGTLLETIAWHDPAFLEELRALDRNGLLDFVGSCYGQNIMRFFSYRHNLRQLNEELDLYQRHLGLDPNRIRTFWSPERLWDTERMAPVLRDPRLLNHGYRYVLVDDRVLLSSQGPLSPRRAYDRGRRWDPQLFQAYRIRQGQGLVALPIADNLRQNIPPASKEQWKRIESQLEWLSGLDPESFEGDPIAIYADDMEKPAGVGWDLSGPSNFEAFLRAVSENHWIRPVKLCEWACKSRTASPRVVEVGTFRELANEFHAGEDYENWYLDDRWRPYQSHLSWSQGQVERLDGLGADPALIALAEKHLLASNWETAWHTPSSGAHGCSESDGGPSGWIKALASHSRHAAVIAEAAFWSRHKDESAHAYIEDIDNDGEEELILKNDEFFAVFTLRWGGRLVYLFHVGGNPGALVIGNPCDDWNLMQELNKCMEVPRNHPGALADLGFEHDQYGATVLKADGPSVHARLRNNRTDSQAFDLVKDIHLSYGGNALSVTYWLPETLSRIDIEFGLSPDYLNLLRCGRGALQEYSVDGARGSRSGRTAVWVRPENGDGVGWIKPGRDFGHGCSLKLAGSGREFTLWIGVDFFSPETTEGAHTSW